MFQRGGRIVPRQMRPRRCADLMAADPFTLVVALDSKQQASGQLYIDDGNTFNFQYAGLPCVRVPWGLWVWGYLEAPGPCCRPGNRTSSPFVN